MKTTGPNARKTATAGRDDELFTQDTIRPISRIGRIRPIVFRRLLDLSRRLLKDAGIDADKEMTLRVIGNTPDRLQALRAGTVDATTLTIPADIHAERLGLRRLLFMGDTMESINGGFGVSERWLQQRPDQIKKMIAVAFRGMAHARAQRQDCVALIMSKWKLEREIAEKAFDMTIRTWADNGISSDQALQAGIEESLLVGFHHEGIANTRRSEKFFAPKSRRFCASW